MLLDGITLTSTSEVQNVHVESGTTFPLSPTIGRAFYLTASGGGYDIGFYIYNGTDWITGDVTGVSVGTGLTGGGVSGNITLNIDTTVMATKDYVNTLVTTGAVWVEPIAANGLVGDNLSTPPGSPAVHDSYIVLATGTGAWTGLDGHLVEWNGSAWVDLGLVTIGMRIGLSMESVTTCTGSFVGHDNEIVTITGVGPLTYSYTALTDGMSVLVNTAASYDAYHAYFYQGATSSWVEFVGPPVVQTIPYDISGSILGKPAGGAVVTRFVAVRGFSIPANCTGSVGKAATAATNSTTLSLQKNGVQFGTMVFAASGTVATFTASSTSFIAGDIFTVVAPGTADTTFGDAEYTFVCTLA